MHTSPAGLMSEIFLGRRGVIFFYVVLIIYLYGDLAIYAGAAPQPWLHWHER